MTRMFGGHIEPDDCDLEDWEDYDECHHCRTPARYWYCERLEGGTIHSYSGMSCTGCGLEEGDQPDD